MCRPTVSLPIVVVRILAEDDDSHVPQWGET